MQLFYTPFSHFSRKVRILLAGLGLDVELIDVGNTALADPGRFGGNPLMSVPVLREGELCVHDSDTIAEYLVLRHDAADRFAVQDRSIARMNLRAVMNGIMSAEVELILAARCGMDIRAHARLDKKRRVIASGLAWLEDRADEIPTAPDYLAFHLISLWEHLAHFRHLPEMPLPRLASRAAVIARLPMVVATRWGRDAQPTLAPTSREPHPHDPRSE